MLHPVMLHSALVVNPGQGKTITLGPIRHVFKLTTDETGGAYSLMEVVLPPHLLVPPHVHTREDELSIVLDGRLGVRVGDQDYELGAGSYIFKPRGIPHTLWNPGDMPSRGVEIISPGGLENYFAELAALVNNGRPDPAQVDQLGHKYGLSAVLDWVPELTHKYGVRPVGHSIHDSQGG